VIREQIKKAQETMKLTKQRNGQTNLGQGRAT